MKKIAILMGIVMLAGLLTACGEKSAKDIKVDIAENYEFFAENQDLEIKEIEIVERKTDSDNKTDEVKVSIVAKNDNFEYKASFQVNYYLYDQGWSMEELKQMEYSLVPYTTNITSDMAYGMLDHAFMFDIWDFAFYTQDDFVFESENIQLENGLHEFIFKSNDGKKKLSVKYSFTREGNNCDWRFVETKEVSN